MSRSIQDDVYLETKLRLLPMLDRDMMFHIPLDIKLFYLETIQQGWVDEWRNFPARDLFVIAREDSRLPEVRVVAGNVGSGRTALARCILRSWLQRDQEFQKLNQYEGVFVVDGEGVEKEQTLPLIQSLLPETIRHWGIDLLFEWVETARILLIIDDFILDTDQEHKLSSILKEWKGTDALILTNTVDCLRLVNLVDSIRPTLYCRFQLLNVSSKTKLTKNVMNEIVKGKIISEPNISIGTNAIQPLLDTFGGIQHYCLLANQFYQIHHNETVSSLLWDSIYICLNASKKHYSLSSDKLHEWLLVLGQRCYECLVRNAPLLGVEIVPVLEATNYIFSSRRNSSFLIEPLLSVRYSLYNNDLTFSVLHEMQQEILAAFFILNKSIEGMPLKKLLKDVKGDRLAIYVAGLIVKMIKEENMFYKPLNEDAKKKFERVVKNLSMESECSSDPITFTLRILHELECRQELVDILLRDVVFPSHLHIHDVGIYADALEKVISHSYPQKIHLLIRRRYKSPEIFETLKLLKNHNVNLAMCDMNHLEWSGDEKTDSYVETLFDSNCVKLQDFIGSLELPTICQLHLKESTRHLVCLRVRVCDSDEAKGLVESQNYLQSLMWLEIDFDFPLQHVFELKLPRITTPLIDLSFRHVGDSDITNLCDFLHSLNNEFSGLHLQKSTVTPQGVTEILKYFFRRSMKLNASEKAILNYRRYRFPEMASLDPKAFPSDEEVERLLGYDDRHHYSENEVRSCYVATRSEANILKNFFALMDLTYFVYTCSNFKVTKQVNGDCVLQKSCI